MGGGPRVLRNAQMAAPALTRDLPHSATTRARDCDFLPLGERQVPPRRRGERDRRHPATLPKPPDADRGRHAHLRRGVLA
jgi:hypothetical protein